MTDQSFTTTIGTDRTPEAVTAAVTDVRGWWSRSLVGDSARPGDVFTYEVPGVHRSTIEVTEVVPGQRVVWRVLDNRIAFVEDQTEWNGTEIRFDVTATEGGAELRFTHVGLVPRFECFEACRRGWTYYIEQSLGGLITTGTGLPDDEPQAVALSRTQSETTSR
ncbi:MULTISPECIES: SRPBCC family protein [Nocardia]|uniref:SRPBCC family protein n=1 Tax=Nocardia TaxID=1817 RepID=UPI000D68EB46|nr:MULTISPECIES: SRPBCC domain-containing protein [Nocardia]